MVILDTDSILTMEKMSEFLIYCVLEKGLSIQVV
jgi:hypothetical protein